MAGGNAKPSATKRPPPPSSSDRMSRRHSSSPANPSKSTPPSSAHSNRPPSDTKSTPRRNSNPAHPYPTPAHPNPTPSHPYPTPAHAYPTPAHPNPSPAHPNPSPGQSRPGGPPPFHLQDPPPPPTYGFHMLDRRTIVLADGSLRSYFALPPDYQDLPPPRPPLDHFFPVGPHPFGPDRGTQDYRNSLRLEGGSGSGSGSMKRKFGDGDGKVNHNNNNEGDELARRRLQLLHYGNVPESGPSSSPFDQFRSSKQMRIGENMNVVRRNEVVDPAVMKAFLKYSKLLNESANQKKHYLEMKNGKHGFLRCLACRSSKEFPDVHSLVVHAYTCDYAESRADHLGLHRALCVLLGWSYLRPPDNSKVYQFLPAEEAAANQDDLILWPPTVIIHNTNTGKGKDGRMEGLGNKTMDSKMRDLGFPGGKSKSLYTKDGHLGITLIKFASDESGLKEAMRLADHFEQGLHGRRHWVHVQSISIGKDDESNPNIMVVDERTGERRRILYGYLGTASDMDKLDHETRKKILVESKYDKLQPPK